GLCELDGRLDELVRLSVGLLELLVGETELLAQLRNRVLRLAQLLDLALWPVDLRIADVVAGQPVRLEEQEDGAASRACVVQGLQRSAVHVFDVLAVDADRSHSVRRGALRE